MRFGPSTSQNWILGSLGADEFRRLEPHLKLVRNRLADVLLHPGDPIEFLYFPETAMASAMGTTLDGGTAEIGLIGFEGVVGVSRLLGSSTQPNEINVQMPGHGAILPAEIAEEEFARGGGFQRAVLRFLNQLLVQLGRTAVCNVMHGLDRRLARWMLMCHDRSPDDTLDLTQEFLSVMVGVTRQSISGAARFLQDARVIRYSRGRIDITDRAGLERFACDCYQVMSLDRFRP